MPVDDRQQVQIFRIAPRSSILILSILVKIDKPVYFTEFYKFLICSYSFKQFKLALLSVSHIYKINISLAHTVLRLKGRMRTSKSDKSIWITTLKISAHIKCRIYIFCIYRKSYHQRIHLFYDLVYFFCLIIPDAQVYDPDIVSVEPESSGDRH